MLQVYGVAATVCRRERPALLQVRRRREVLPGLSILDLLHEAHHSLQTDERKYAYRISETKYNGVQSETTAMQNYSRCSLLVAIVTTAERDCAFQKDIVQVYNWKERQWHPEERIDKEAYGEGCFKGEDRGAPNGPSEYCFCSRNYCNSTSSAKLCGILVILALLLMKLCR